jgi:hypothetical protein
MHSAGHKAVVFHLPQSLGEHLLAYVPNQFSEARKSQDPMPSEHLQHQHGPFVGHPADDLLYKGVQLGAGSDALG